MPLTPNLNAYLYFETVARRGTITRAAEELSVSPSAVSQQVKLLEQRLGVKLFRRDGRVLSLTLEGSTCSSLRQPRCGSCAMRGATLAKPRDASAQPARHTSFGVRWLAPGLRIS